MCTSYRSNCATGNTLNTGQKMNHTVKIETALVTLRTNGKSDHLPEASEVLMDDSRITFMISSRRLLKLSPRLTPKNRAVTVADLSAANSCAGLL